MRKIIVTLFVAVLVPLPAFADIAREKMPPYPDMVVPVADFPDYISCMNGKGAINMREIPQGWLNPAGLTVSNPKVLTTGILGKNGSPPKTCVATYLVATHK